MTADLLLTGVSQGLILAMITYGIMIPFRFLDFPDLTAEGAYPLGGAVCASLIASGVSISLATLASMITAGMMGVGTGLVNLKLKVNTLLAGIILSTMAYSINLRIMGQPNISLFNDTGAFIFDDLNSIPRLFILCLLCIIPFTLFLYSDFGLRFRSVGLNKNVAMKQGISVDRYTLLGLFIAGALYGLAGCLIVQMQSYMDIGMGVGIAIHGLAGLMIGEAVVGNKTLLRQLSAPLVGAMTYQQIQGLAISLGLAPSDLKFFTGLIVLVVIAIRRSIRGNTYYSV